MSRFAKEESPYTPYPDLFPGFELVDVGEAEILVGNGEVLKIYRPEYTEQAIEFYAAVTNKLAYSLQGVEIPINFPDGTQPKFEITVNPVTKIDKLGDGRMYTKGSFIGGPHFEEFIQLARTFGAVSWLSYYISTYPYDIPSLITFHVEEVMLSQLQQNEKPAVRLALRNYKAFGDGENNRINVTDISSSIRVLI